MSPWKPGEDHNQVKTSLAPPTYVLFSIFISLQYYVWVYYIFAGFLQSNIVRADQRTEGVAENNYIEVVSQFEL